MNRVYLTLSLILIFVFSSCNDNPTEIGTEFLRDSINVSSVLISDSVIIDVKSYYYNSPQLRNTGALFVGNTADFSSVGMIRFNIPVNRTDIKVEDITECNIHINFNNYTIGNNTLSFQIKEVISRWNTETDVDDVLSGTLFSNNSIAEWTGELQVEDTSFSIILPFPPEIIVDWFAKINDGVDIQDTIWGIGFVPNDQSNVIASFKALSNETLAKGTFIDIKYKTNDAEDEENIDSLIIHSAEEVSFVKDKKNNLNENSITLQGGARIHTKFTFDLTNIPTLAAINNSDIVLFLDDTESENDPPDSLHLNYFAERNEIMFMQMIRVSGYYDKDSKSYIFKNGLNSVLNYFIRNNNKTGELVLMYSNTDNENNKIEKLNFLYDPADKHKHIKLRIFYSGL